MGSHRWIAFGFTVTLCRNFPALSLLSTMQSPKIIFFLIINIRKQPKHTQTTTDYHICVPQIIEMFALQFFSPKHNGLWVTISNLVLPGLFMLLSMGKPTKRGDHRLRTRKHGCSDILGHLAVHNIFKKAEQGLVAYFHSCCSFDQHSMWRHALH